MAKAFTISINFTLFAIIVVLNSPSSFANELIILISLLGCHKFLFLLLYGLKPKLFQFLNKFSIVLSMIFKLSATPDNIAQQFRFQKYLNQNVLKYSLSRYNDQRNTLNARCRLHIYKQIINQIRIIRQSFSIIEFLAMSESVYKPKQCAFHPKEIIFNFCRNQDCLLPLCPTCVDVHSEEHKQQKTYGKFQNIHNVVNDLTFNMENSIKQLDNFTEQIKEQLAEKTIDQQQLRRQIAEAKERVLGLVQRFFMDFEKEVNKSIVQFNVSMKENYRQMQNQIKSMKSELSTKIEALSTEKVLKTVISFHSKEEDKKMANNITVLKETLDLCGSKRANLMIDNNSIQKMINQLSQFMFLSFQNWEQDIKYVADFIKTGFTARSSSRSCSLVNE